MILVGIVLGLVLSFAQLEGLRRSVNRILDCGKDTGKAWAILFVLRYGLLALSFWLFLEILKPNVFPFIISFVLSHFILRHWYRRIAYV